jgi:hypothetical protein
MLTLIPTQKAGVDKISSNLTTLSISWLNQQFCCVAIHRGAVVGTWETLVDPENGTDFASLIREAVQKTNYHGTAVSLVLANSRLVQQLVDVPPVTGSALNKVIQREALQQKLFSGEAAWAFQNSLAVKGVQRVILHLLPKSLLDRLMLACRQNNLNLNSVLPVSAVLHHQLTQLPLDKGDVALLAAETSGNTTVVVARADGQLLLVRTLIGSWNENVERLVLDLKRTSSFISQQHGLTINRGMWVFGTGAEQQAKVLQPQVETSVTVSPVPYESTYWAIEAAKLRPAITPNFIGEKLQHAPQRRIFARIVAVCTALLVAGSLALAVVLHVLARQEAASTVILQKRVDQLQAQHQQLEQRNAELASKSQLVQLVLEGRHPPVPAWVLGYLSEAVPADLVVTSFHVKLEDDLWKLHLAGTLQTSDKPAAPTALNDAVGVLADRLANGPFHLTILSRSDHDKSARPNSKSAPVNQFVIEGVMR